MSLSFSSLVILCRSIISLTDNSSHDFNCQQALHPLVGLPSHNGVTYTWVSPPKNLPRKRTVFTRNQRTQLELKFQNQKYISKPDRIKFARELGLKDSQVR